MLSFFRQHPLRKSLWLVILFSSLLTHTQNLFACDLMDNGPQTTCCCDEDMSKGCSMGGGCDTSDNNITSGCCDVSIDVNTGLQDVATATHFSKQILSLDAPQPPPAIIISNEFLLPVSNNPVTFAVRDYSQHVPSSGSLIYLVTSRFRI